MLRKEYYTYYIFLLFSFNFQLSTFNLSAQPTQEWVRIFDGPDHLDDYANDMAIDTSGNIYVTGEIHTQTQNSNFGTIKYNQSGVLQWQAFYNGPGANSIDAAVAIALDKSGNVFVTGYSERGGFGSDDYATIKYNSSGTQLWVARYSGPAGGANDPTAICTDDSGFVYVTGFSTGSGTGDDIATIKYNQNGDSVWVRRYNGPGNGNDAPSSIAADNSGNVYLTGRSGSDIVTIKYNSVGNLKWAARYSRGFGGGRAIVVDKNGYVYVTGSSSTSATSDDYTTIKYDSMGVQQWLKIYNGIGSNPTDDPFDIKVDKWGNVYVTGYSVGANNFSDYLTIKYNSNGDTNWVRRFNGIGNNDDIAYSIAIDSFSNTFVTGRSLNNSNSYDITTVKYDVNGLQQWAVRYPGVGLKSMIDKLQNLYILGNNSESGTGSDYVTIKYSSLLGIISVSNQIPVKSALFQNFPNPFNPSTNIKYQIVKNGLVTLKIYNVLGMEITTLVSQIQKPGTYEVNWSGEGGVENISSGIYFYKIISGEYTDTKKMILIK